MRDRVLQITCDNCGHVEHVPADANGLATAMPRSRSISLLHEDGRYVRAGAGRQGSAPITFDACSTQCAEKLARRWIDGLYAEDEG